MRKYLRAGYLGCLTLPFLLLFVACDKSTGGSKIAPKVTPIVAALGSDSVVIKWNNVGRQYYYSVVLGKDSIQDDDFRNLCGGIDSIADTVCKLDSLLPNTFYKVFVLTFGGNVGSSQSWPPLRFKTLE